MNLPCITCKYRKETTQAHRIFVGCKNKDRKKKHFIEDSFCYWHTCTGYVKDDKIKETK